MRDFFINGFEIILSVIIVAAAVGVAAAAMGALMGEVPLPDATGLPPASGPLAALAILLGGWLAVLFVGGALFLGLGIYRNTARTADALELLITLRR